MTEGARALTVKEAAERARVSVKTIRRAYTDGRLPFYRPRGSQVILLLDSDVDEWALQPAAPRRAPLVAAPVSSRARRAPVSRMDSRRRLDPGSREDLRAIERSTT
jgi:excisionase family DNA binding protein